MIRPLRRVFGCVMVLLIGGVTCSTQPGRPRNDLARLNAQLDAGLYNEAERSARVHLDRLRASRSTDPLLIARASDVLVRALILNGRAASDESLSLARNSVHIKESRLGASHPDVGSSLLNLGDVLAARAEFDEAIAVGTRTVALQRFAAGSDSLALADALDHLGSTLAAARRHDDARRVLDESLGLKEAVLDEDNPSIARTLEDLGLVLQRMGAYEESSPLLRRAETIRTKTGADHPVYVGTLNLLAQQLWFEGRLIESREMSERAVDLAERTLRPDHPNLALSFRFLAATLEDLGDMRRSIALRERALATIERNFGENHHETAAYVHALGSAELRQGAYAAARQRFQRALDIFEARYGTSHDYVAATLSMLARANANLGDYAAARQAQSRVVSIRERVSGPTHPFVANSLTDLANTYRQERAPVQALPLLERALAIREKNLGPDHREVARTLADLATTLQEVGRASRAQSAATRALAIWDRLKTPNAPEYATALALYADLQARQGNDLAARDYYERAMTIRARVFGKSHPSYADAQAGFAAALARLGERPAALSNALSAEATGRAHLRTMLQSLPERQSLEYAAVRPRALDLILSLAEPESDAVDAAMDGLVRSRAQVLDEMATRGRSRRISPEGSDPVRLAFTSAQQRLANLLVRGPGQLSPDRYATLVDHARRESEQAEQALAEQSAEFRAEQGRRQIGLSEVKRSIPSGNVLVSFVRYNRTDFGSGTPPSNRAHTRSSSMPSYLAFVTYADRPTAVVPLGPAQTIDSLVTRWRSAIAKEAARVEDASGLRPGSAFRVSGVALRRLVWDRLSPHIHDASRVFIVPDGALSLVPFVALPLAAGSHLLERGPVIHYLSAERDLVTNAADEIGQGLLAIGGAAFDDASLFSASQGQHSAAPPQGELPSASRSAEAPCAPVQQIKFASLKGTLQEVQDVSKLWSASGVSNEAFRVLVGRDASEPALKREAPRYRVLHFATHGFLLDDSCAPVRPDTRAVGGLVLTSNSQSTAAATNPLRLSGLALAGANRRDIADANEDDGILTAEEVASMNLGGVEWAVLSACETGLGEIRAGEGVFGLRRAFQIAGARTVIMSLWSVDDDATRHWMRSLYQSRLQNKLTTADAIHAASLAVLRSRRASGQSTHPFYWAAFVAAGDWR